MITIIAAVARNGAIGSNGGIPWKAPEDMAFFKETTMGQRIVMGRKTWASLPRRPLPGRDNVVLSRVGAANVPERTMGFDVPGGPHVYMDAAGYLVRVAGRERDEYVIGGADIYRVALPLADRLLITEVDVDVPDADAFFPYPHLFAPQVDPLVAGAGWKCTGRTVCPGGWPGPEFREVSRRPGTDPRLTFVTWERVR